MEDRPVSQGCTGKMPWSWRVPKGRHFRVFLNKNAAFLVFKGMEDCSLLLQTQRFAGLPFLSVMSWTENLAWPVLKHGNRNVHDCRRRKIDKAAIDKNKIRQHAELQTHKPQHNTVQPLLTQYNEVHNLTYQFKVQISHQVDG